MKKNITILITLFFVIITTIAVNSLTVNAASKGRYFLSGELYYHTISKNEVEVCGTTRNEGTLTIPSSVYYKGKKYKVTQIADHELYYQAETDTAGGKYMDLNMPACKYYDYHRTDGKQYPLELKHISFCMIKKVILPSTLTYIGEGAFGGCYKLKSVVFANSYKKLTIGKNAFDGTSLKSIRFPKGTYELKECAAGTVAEIYIPASVKKIGAGVVNYKTKKVTIDKKNKKFKMKDGILYSYNGKTLIGASAKVKKNIKIPKAVTKIGQMAFAGTNVKTVTLNDKIKTIPKGAFYECEKLTSVKLTKNVRKVEYGAFARCYKLKDIGALPNLAEIERAAFWDDSKLTLHLSKKVATIDDYAFCGYEYSYGAKVTVEENHPIFSIQDDFLVRTTTTDKTIILSMKEAEQIIIPEGITSVVCYVGGENCKKIILPSTLNKLYGNLETKEGRVVFKGAQPPIFRDKYRMRGVKSIVVPKGTYDIYKKAIGESYDDDYGDYYIWDDENRELVEE